MTRPRTRSPGPAPSRKAAAKPRKAAAKPRKPTAKPRATAPTPKVAPRKNASSLSNHLDTRGHVHMVNVGEKTTSARRARAIAHVDMAPATVERLRNGDTPKGDVLAVARIAAIQAAKRTSELIPLCHPVTLTHVEVDLRVETHGVRLEVIADAVDRTGVEMEAMVAASVGALTLYDMLKGIDREMTYSVYLEEKKGGKTGPWKRHAR